ncbi:hypothetical protein RRG08_059724 [Elysia crispata]|uniref:Uncharacterized protein n=1 Tax=Elysia crispata TaxID=231223 RepID=A0AAE0YP45_9GAST|nr:hypothetical protein RRG08_059724 [Elysia crispata]
MRSAVRNTGVSPTSQWRTLSAGSHHSQAHSLLAFFFDHLMPSSQLLIRPVTQRDSSTRPRRDTGTDAPRDSSTRPRRDTDTDAPRDSSTRPRRDTDTDAPRDSSTRPRRDIDTTAPRDEDTKSA